MSIARADATHDQPAQAVYVCGGSACNGVLLRDLREALGGGVRGESTEVLDALYPA